MICPDCHDSNSVCLRCDGSGHVCDGCGEPAPRGKHECAGTCLHKALPPISLLESFALSVNEVNTAIGAAQSAASAFGEAATSALEEAAQ